MAGIPPRVVLATRPTELEQLIERHSTLGQVRFFLQSRGRSVDELQVRHAQHEAAVHDVLAAIPPKWRRARVERGDFDRFLFQDEDIVVAVGQDGLVPNLAKYLSGQPVVGINPSPDWFDGVLVRHEAGAIDDLLQDVAAGRGAIEERAMVAARLDDGQELLALNELFVGHCSHQSARYRIATTTREERQSSSGLIVATGTGATGWASSIRRQRKCKVRLPSAVDEGLVFFVREAFASAQTGTRVTEGAIPTGEALRIVSEMEDGGVVFGDGIESDFLRAQWGQTIEIRRATHGLRLVA